MNQQQIEALATDGLIVSGSMQEHFVNIVPSMNAIGAKRRGSKPMQDSAGNLLIVDVYIMPDGKTILAGYKSQF